MLRLVFRTPAGVLALGLMLPVSGSLLSARSTPSVVASEVVERFLSNAESAELTSYRAFRTLEAESLGGKVKGRLTAWTTLDPVRGFSYEVVEESGSGTVRQKVLHAALEAERQMRNGGEAATAAVTPNNYEFIPGDWLDEGLVRIAIRPKRRDQVLVDGSIVLTMPGGDLKRVEGVLSKRPSFWTRDVHVVRQYERIAGVRVPVSMQSNARVLVAGHSTFSMAYEYESINGERVTTPVQTVSRVGP